MKTSAQIQFDFAQARRRAEEIDEISADLRKLVNKDMQELLSDLSAVWKGENAGAYRAKAELLGGQIKETAQELAQIASGIRTVARQMYEAEMEALRIATRDTSGGGFSGGGGSGGSRL